MDGGGDQLEDDSSHEPSSDEDISLNDLLDLLDLDTMARWQLMVSR